MKKISKSKVNYRKHERKLLNRQDRRNGKKIVKRESNHKCEECGKQDETVRFQENAGMAEVYDDHSKHWICDECNYESFMDS